MMQETLTRKTSELEQAKSLLMETQDFANNKSRKESEEIEYLKRAILQMEHSLSVEKENRIKIENIKNNDRRELA